MKTTSINRTACLGLALALFLCLPAPASALCPIGKANAAADEADKAYEAALAAMDQSKENASVVLTEPGQGVTAAPGMAPGEGASDEDKARLDGVAVDTRAWMPN